MNNEQELPEEETYKCSICKLLFERTQVDIEVDNDFTELGYDVSEQICDDCYEGLQD